MPSRRARDASNWPRVGRCFSTRSGYEHAHAGQAAARAAGARLRRVGSNRTIHCNVRIIAATHRNLEQSIKRGFVPRGPVLPAQCFPIEVPPLRERVEDIPVLVNDLILRIEHEKRGSVRLTPLL